ncbi:MAG: DUF309 domain-containing protein [Candidatus Caenarcaniphilales bacterium]|nr:DUF309 domain-containing protein [Candidatus Caenarcaniphilales bacterium]
MSAKSIKDRLKEGITLFNRKEFYEAHEVFEELWQEADSEEMQEEFLFLVRLGAAGVHLVNQNFSGLFLFQLAEKQLSGGLKLNFLNNSLDFLGSLRGLIARLSQAEREKLTQIALENCFELVAAEA